MQDSEFYALQEHVKELESHKNNLYSFIARVAAELNKRMDGIDEEIKGIKLYVYNAHDQIKNLDRSMCRRLDRIERRLEKVEKHGSK